MISKYFKLNLLISKNKVFIYKQINFKLDLRKTHSKINNLIDNIRIYLLYPLIKIMIRVLI